MAARTDQFMNTLVPGLEISAEELARRKQFLEFGEEDVQRLTELSKTAQRYADAVIDELYEHFLTFKETKSFFEDPKVLERVKGLQKDYFLRLTQGDYGNEYVQNRLGVGAVHQRIGLDLKWYLGAYRRYMQSVVIRLFEAFKDEPRKALDYYLSMKKLVFLDIGLALDTYIRTINVQQEAIRELSTPVLQVREGLLILPIIGLIDSQRARQLTEQLLRSIRTSRARVVVLDITGVGSIDSKVANHLVQTVDAARLMGATAIVSGLSPDVAQTVVTLGVDLSKIRTVGDLQGGIELAERLLGYKVTKLEDDLLDDMARR
jgi:rsbT co-antagonist protein RsbR